MLSDGDRMTGSVTEFDEALGLGIVSSPDHEYPFHCISIADGSRTIEVGTTVSFRILFKLGRREAADIRPVA